MCECAVGQLMTAWTTAGSAPAWVVESKTLAAVQGARAAARGCGPFLAGLGAGGLPDQPRDQGTGSAAVGAVLADLHRQDFHRGHLLIEEFHQPPQRGRYLVGDEDQPDPPHHADWPLPPITVEQLL